MAAPRATRSATDGFVLVAVLWILGALASLVSIYTLYVINARASFTLHNDRLRTEALVSAAVELTAFRLLSAPQPRPVHGQFAFRLRSANVAVEFQSEAARIDLNAAPDQILSGLFVTLGTSPENAQTYVNRIKDWRTSRWTRAGSQTVPGNGAGRNAAKFFNINELTLVPGLPGALVGQVMPFVTVFSGRSQINMLDAAPQVLAALPGMTADRLNDFLAQRSFDPENITALSQLLGPAQSYATTEGGRTSRITVHVSFDNGDQETSEVVILLFEEGSEPFSVLSWRVDADQPNASQRARPW